jgi:cytoskeletal protein RodZ
MPRKSGAKDGGMETIMKRIIGIGTALLLLFATGGAFSQEPESEKEKKKPQQEEPKKPDKPSEKEKTSSPPPSKSQPSKPAEPPSKPNSKEKAKQKEKPEKQETSEKPNAARASSDKTKHGGRRIPDPQFQSSFGRQHTFQVQRSEGRHFQTGGATFEVVEVWPSDWIFEDECYIDFVDDDYYLIDVIHPEHRIIVIVVE